MFSDLFHTSLSEKNNLSQEELDHMVSKWDHFDKDLYCRIQQIKKDKVALRVLMLQCKLRRMFNDKNYLRWI